MSTPELRRRLQRVAESQQQRQHAWRAREIAERAPRSDSEIAATLEALIQCGKLPPLPPKHRSPSHRPHPADDLCDECRSWQHDVDVWFRSADPNHDSRMIEMFRQLEQGRDWPVSDEVRNGLEQLPARS